MNNNLAKNISSSSKWKKAEKLLKERAKINCEINSIENKLYKIENEYLELTQGNNLFRNLEFYIHVRPEKKKNKIEECDRVFAKDFPK